MAAIEPVMENSLLMRLLQGAQRPEAAALPASLLPLPGQPARVVEARVLSASLLQPPGQGPTAGGAIDPAANPGATLEGTATNSAANLARYRVQLAIAGQPRIAAILSAPTLIQGQAIQLSVDAQGQLRLVGEPALQPPSGSQGAIPAGAYSAGLSPAPSEALSQLQHWTRLLLPRQQPLHELAPVLQRWLSSAATAAPGSTSVAPAVRDLAEQWLSRLSTPESLSEASSLRAALRDSGTLTESLWREALATGAPPPRDQKSLLLQLLRLLQSPVRPAQPQAAAPDPARAGPGGTAPQPTATSGTAAEAATRQEAGTASTEAVLRQLGAAIARTQLHQLDSLGARQSHTADPQQPNATWSFEVPVRDGPHTSSMQLQIHRRDARKADPAQIRWQVEIRLDLHDYGRFSARLELLGQQVSATLWAEQARTHQKVRQHLSALRLGLETVGVKVNRLDCRRGTPSSTRPAFRRQLVDLRT